MWNISQTIILAITGVIIALYTLQTYKLRKQADQTNAFTALTAIHQKMTDRESYTIRRYLLTRFADDLTNVVQKVFGSGYITNISGLQQIDINRVKQLQKDKATLDKFNEYLSAYHTPVNNVNGLEAVEWTLLDFDIIALPLSMKIDAAKEVAKAYKPVLEKTAKKLQPFIIIQRQLRGESEYKRHYLDLLCYLKIPIL